MCQEGEAGKREHALRNQPLIQMERVTKVFFAEKVETHALSNVHLKIGVGEHADRTIHLFDGQVVEESVQAGKEK